MFALELMELLNAVDAWVGVVIIASLRVTAASLLVVHYVVGDFVVEVEIVVR